MFHSLPFGFPRNIAAIGRSASHQQPNMAAWRRGGARQLGRNDCASVLQKTLDEEHMTDKKLTSLAEGKINRRAAS
jgi:hypothetical protein